MSAERWLVDEQQQRQQQQQQQQRPEAVYESDKENAAPSPATLRAMRLGARLGAPQRVPLSELPLEDEGEEEEEEERADGA